MTIVRSACAGTVTGLRGQKVVATGKIYINEEHVFRDAVHKLLRTRGAGVTTKLSGQVSLLVYGDLSSQTVTDPLNQHSRKIKDAFRENHLRHHVCIVSSRGLSQLLDGEPAMCLHRFIIS